MDANIDALVFELYDLDTTEIGTVMQSLGISSSYQRSVLDHFGKRAL
jgi:hypothetical protein